MPWPFIFLVTYAFAAITLPADARTFKIATIAPDGTVWMEELRKGAAQIASRTDGRVKFRFYPGGVMGNDKSVLRKMRIGQLQGGAVTGEGLAEIDPDTLVYGLPLYFRSYDEVDYVRQQMDPLFLRSLEQKGYSSFGFGETGFAYLMSNRPIRKVKDLKGQKVWIPQGDRISRSAFEAVDVTPIPLPLTDVLTALQTGLIDTVASSPLGAIALQWHTRVKYVTDTPLVYLLGTLVISRKAFEKLSTEDQSVVRDVMERAYQTLNRNARGSDKSSWEALARQGISFVEPTQADRQYWQDLMSAEMERLADKGVFSLKMLKTLRRHLDDYRRKQGLQQ